MPGAARLLWHLHSHGIPMALATSTSRATYEAKMCGKAAQSLCSVFQARATQPSKLHPAPVAVACHQSTHVLRDSGLPPKYLTMCFTLSQEVYDLDPVQYCDYGSYEDRHRSLTDGAIVLEIYIEQSCLCCRQQSAVTRSNTASRRLTASMRLLQRLAWRPRTAWWSRMPHRACRPPRQLA